MHSQETIVKKLLAHVYKIKWAEYCLAISLVVLATIICEIVNWHDAPANMMMIYLLAVVYCAASLSRGPAILASIISILIFIFLFVPPVFTFSHSDTKYIFSLCVLLAVAILISELTARARQQIFLAQENAKMTKVQYLLSHDLSSAKNIYEMASIAQQQISNALHCPIVILLPQNSPPQNNRLTILFKSDAIIFSENEMQIAQRVFQTKALVSNSSYLFAPLLIESQKIIGVIGFIPNDYSLPLNSSNQNLALTFANQTAIALERSILWKESEEANLRIEKERMKSTLLSSVSHDLRTPLATITGAASSLLVNIDSISPNVAKELIQSIYDEADRLNRLVSNLLDMTKLQSGVISLKRDWHSLEEIVGSALVRFEKRLLGHTVKTQIPFNLPLIEVDGSLLEQLFINLLDNAIKYSPADSEIHISANTSHEKMNIVVFNTGSEISTDEESKIFEKFYRGRHTITSGGVGLGLAICKAIIEAHDGKIWAEAQPGAGIGFIFYLPLTKHTPQIEVEMEGVK